jgi:hypothetical protein
MRRERAWRRAWVGAVLGLALTTACQTSKVERVVSRLELRYTSSCAPSGVDQITIEALGDYPQSEASFASLDAQGAPVTLSSLPFEARSYRVNVRTARFLGVGLAPAADEGERFDALVLPLQVACPVLERGVTRRSGAALSLLGGRDVWIAGGFSQQGIAVSNAQRLSIAGERVTAAARLFVPRAFAVALQVGAESWILGGSQTELTDAPAFDSFERYDATGKNLLGSGKLARARMEAGAVVLADGSVLVAGGAAQVMGPALDSMERISREGADGELSGARLPFGARNPRLLLRDDGLVVIALNDEEGKLALALYDPVSDSLEALAVPNATREAALVLTLPGARIALIESEAGQTTSALWLIDARGQSERVTGSLTSFAGLADARSLALRDGRVLLTGKRANVGTSRTIDPGTLAVRAAPLPLVPDQLLLRDDGVVAMLSQTALAVMRTDTRSPYDNPAGTLLAEDQAALSLDAKGHWIRNGLSLRALSDGARLDLSGLSFADVRVVIEASAAAELLVRRVNGDERAVEIGTAEIGPALCTMAHEPGQRVTVERHAERISITTGDQNLTCVLDGLGDRIALAARVDQTGTELRFLSVERL